MFDLDKEIIGNVKGAWSASDQGVQLPFDNVLFWWKRGGDERSDGVLKYGGWVASYENVMDVVTGDVPSKLESATFNSMTGGTYDVFATRNMAFAPIGKRFQWAYRYSPEGERDPSDKGRGHLQVLGISAFLNEDRTYNIWKATILSAKGLSAKTLQDALAEWDKKTIAIRSSEGNGIPSNFFWLHLGTFGKEVNKMRVGSGNKANYITPIQIYIPEELNIEYLKKVYVGKGVATTMSVLASESKEWLAEWDNKKGDKPAVEEPQPEHNDEPDDFMLP